MKSSEKKLLPLLIYFPLYFLRDVHVGIYPIDLNLIKQFISWKNQHLNNPVAFSGTNVRLKVISEKQFVSAFKYLFMTGPFNCPVCLKAASFLGFITDDQKLFLAWQASAPAPETLPSWYKSSTNKNLALRVIQLIKGFVCCSLYSVGFSAHLQHWEGISGFIVGGFGLFHSDMNWKFSYCVYLSFTFPIRTHGQPLQLFFIFFFSFSLLVSPASLFIKY